MDLILKPRPGGKCTTLTLFSAAIEAVAKVFQVSHCLGFFFYSGERISGPLQGRVGKDSGSGGSTEKASQQALCGRTAAERPVYVWQEKHRHCIWTGWFSIAVL